jgi:lysozyme
MQAQTKKIQLLQASVKTSACETALLASELREQDEARALQIQILLQARAADARHDPAAAHAAWSTLYIHADDPAFRAAARDALVHHAGQSWPGGFRADFLTSLSPTVLSASRAHQVLPSVTLAQAVLESGWGRSGLTRGYHNLFGVKAGSSSKRICLASWEYIGGRFWPSHQIFCRYDSKAQSIRAHAELLSTDRRYAHARKHWTNREDFLDAIAPRYASSPNYVRAVNEIIELYALDRWDDLIIAAVEADQRAPAPVVTADDVSEPLDEPSDTGQPPPSDG